MKTKNKLTKNQSELLKLLGQDYSPKRIDLELCLYRKLNDDCDFEISGTSRKGREMTVYIWDIRAGEGHDARIIETVRGIKDAGQLKQALDELVCKYNLQ